MTRRILKPFCRAIATALPHHSVARRVFETRILKTRFTEYMFRTECPLVRRQFADEAWHLAHCFVLGSSHVIYGFDPSGMTRVAWNMGVSNCDFRTMYYVTKKIFEMSEGPNIVICVDFWMRSLQTEYTRDFAVLSMLDALKIVPLRSRFLARYWRRFGASISENLPNDLEFRNGYFAGRKHWDGSVDDRVLDHLRFMKYEPTELIWLRKLLILCKSFNVSPLVVFPPVRKDYRDRLQDKGDLFSEYRDICACENVEIKDCFSSADYESEDWGDADHLNEKGAIKFAHWLDAELSIRVNRL